MFFCFCPPPPPNQLCDSECVSRKHRSCLAGAQGGAVTRCWPLGEGQRGGHWRRDSPAAGPAVGPPPSSAPPRLFEQLCTYSPLDKPWHCLPLVQGQRPYRNGMILLP